jgi:hypothetical protein
VSCSINGNGTSLGTFGNCKRWSHIFPMQVNNRLTHFPSFIYCIKMAKIANLKKAVYKCKQKPGKIVQTSMEEKSLVK